MPKDVTPSTADNPQALKHLLGPALLARMAASLQAAHPTFDRQRFLELKRELEPLEMKPRVRLIRDRLRELLPAAFGKAVRVLLTSAHDGSLKSFDLWPYTDFIQTFGLDETSLSLDALRALTALFTSEFAVRPFLRGHPVKTLRYLERCARDASVDVRRWASEGTRPRLPWGERLHEFIKNPAPGLKILEILKFDPELYVRKSVSNHLNDIAKDHPDLVVKTLRRWKKEAGPKHDEKVRWITHRSLRTLIKAGHPEALKLIGVSASARVQVSGLKLAPRKVRLGERLEFEFMLRSLDSSAQRVVVDYILHFVKAHRGTAPKVFKLKTLELPARSATAITKSHHLKSITTRVYYPGVQRLEIQVNGKIAAEAKWELTL